MPKRVRPNQWRQRLKDRERPVIDSRGPTGASQVANRDEYVVIFLRFPTGLEHEAERFRTAARARNMAYYELIVLLQDMLSRCQEIAESCEPVRDILADLDLEKRTF